MAIYMMDGYYCSSDSNLTQDQIDHNARGFFTLFYRLGFSPGAICAMLGNIQAESGINPAKLQGSSADPIPDNQTMLLYIAGAGVVQWTPAKDTIVPFAINIGRNWYSMLTQYLRLKYEYENDFEFIGVTVHGQYYNWDIFHDYEVDPVIPLQTVNDLAEAFLRGYLRPSNPEATLANRQYYSRLWYNELKDFRPFSPLFYRQMSKPDRKELRSPCQRV